MILLGCLITLLLAGLAERLALARARRAVPIRIHVNGTRGKSTVTRLVAGALREAGIPTLAKVTGTAPRLILPDGTERPIRRLAPASIREQGWVLRQARRQGARALVAECMAVRPELQWTSERDILCSTLGVITNVRLDHTEVMGRSIEQIARSLANTVPRHAVMITGDPRAATVLAERCATEATRLVVVSGRRSDPANPPDQGSASEHDAPDRLAADPICLAVARELGIDEATARRGMQKAAADPGAAASGIEIVAGRRLAWLDLTAANDPESTDLMVARWADEAGSGHSVGTADQAASADATGGTICVYNHRGDRPDRLVAFIRWSRVFRAADFLLLTGDRPALPLSRRARRACRGGGRFVSTTELSTVLTRLLETERHLQRVVYCGNTRGFVRPVLGR